MSVRYFALHDDAVRNGSFQLIRRSRELGCYVASYMNGDYIGRDRTLHSFGSGLTAEINKAAAELVAGGLQEYDIKKFKSLAPACCGGKGNS